MSENILEKIIKKKIKKISILKKNHDLSFLKDLIDKNNNSSLGLFSNWLLNGPSHWAPLML